MPTCPWAPRPTGSPHNRHVIHPEADHGERSSKKRSKDDIPAMMPMIEPTGCGDEESNRSRYQNDDHCVYRGRSSLFSDAGMPLSRTRLSLRLLREYSILGAASRFRCKRVRGEIWEADGELGTQPEGEVYQSCERDCTGQFGTWSIGSWDLLQEQCPLGKLENPLTFNESDLLRQISQVTRTGAPGIWSPRPPTAYLAMLDRSGLQRASMSGRGLPKRFFNPSVAMNAPTTASPRPSQPACHCHSFCRQIRAQRWLRLAFLSTMGPGIQRSETTAMITAGAIKATTTATPMDIVCGFTQGREMLGSDSEKG